MSLRNRSGNWHYRFFAAGRTWTADTGLVATERNRSGALMKEAAARKLIGEGLPEQLKIQVKPFSDAADPLHTINVGQVQDYMSWRRLCTECSSEGCDVCDQTGQGVREITLRHDLHALSPLFKYCINHNLLSKPGGAREDSQRR